MSDRIRHLVELTEEDLKNLIQDLLNKMQAASPSSAKPEIINDLISRQETAKLFGISLVTLAKWARLKILPRPIKKGGRVFYRKSEINNSLLPKSQA
jgi:predicted DNA-binding transcriptional regulator AlpA